MRTLFQMLLRGVRWVFTALLAVVLLFEEWGWAPLLRLLRRLGELPVLGRAWRWLEASIRGLGRWPALLVFAVPVLALFPIKLLALKAMATGHRLAGLVVLLVAKVVGTALVAWLFSLTEPALMRFAWFARWYPRWLAWKDALLTRARQWLRAQLPWRLASRWGLRVANAWRTVRR